MGFFFNETKAQATSKKRGGGSGKHIPIESLNKMGCKVCSLDKAKLKSPKIQPDGPTAPLVYVLSEYATEDDDRKGLPFSGPAGKLLRDQFSDKALRQDVTFGHVVRCYPGAGKIPEVAETECCRGLAVGDIEARKPLVVVGAGNQTLNWATGINNGVQKWRGRYLATQIGNHPCWFYPILEPDYVLRNKGKYGKSETMMAFEHDLRVLWATIPEEPPIIYDAPYDTGIELIMGNGRADLLQLEHLLTDLLKEPQVGIDIETSGLRPYADNSKIYTAAVGTFNKTVAFPLDHPEAWSGSDRKKAWGLFTEFLLQSGRKVAHHVGFEMEWLGYHVGKEILRLTEWEDTMAMAHTLNESPGTHSLDVLCRQHFGFYLKAQSRVDVSLPDWIKKFTLKEVLRYNGLDTKWTDLLATKLLPEIDAEPKYRVEYERKVNLAPTLVLTQLKGVPVDFEYANTMKTTLDGEAKAIERKIEQCSEVKKYSQRFGRFEPTNTDHVLKLMKEVLQREEIEKDGGGYTTDEGALSKMPAREVPSAPLVLEHRAVKKLSSTYVDPLVNGKMTNSDGLIHTQYSSMRAVTGRLASEDPNMQNFPKRKRKEIRGMIAAPAGQWIVAADYGQIEARVVGMASEDDFLVRALWTGYDIHGSWAERFMEAYGGIKDRMIKDYRLDGDDLKSIRKKFRDEIKNGWVFPQFFGSSVFSCARNLQVPEDIAKEMAGAFWDEFKGVKRWQEKLLKNYEKNLYVETLSGRRRRGVMTKNEIINHPIQGTALDIVTAAMDSLSEKAMEQDNDFLQPNINIHDDLTFFIDDEAMEASLDIIAPEMCLRRFDYINVPLVVEVSIAARWNELKEIAVYRSNELFNERSPYE